MSVRVLFYGDYEPQFDTIRETAEVHRVMDEIEELEHRLKKELDRDGQALLRELLKDESELRYMAFADYYTEVRTGSVTRIPPLRYVGAGVWF